MSSHTRHSRLSASVGRRCSSASFTPVRVSGACLSIRILRASPRRAGLAVRPHASRQFVARAHFCLSASSASLPSSRALLLIRILQAGPRHVSLPVHSHPSRHSAFSGPCCQTAAPTPLRIRGRALPSVSFTPRRAFLALLFTRIVLLGNPTRPGGTKTLPLHFFFQRAA